MIHNRLSQLLQQKNMTAEALSIALHFPPAMVQQWLEGSKVPTLDQLVRLCDFLEVSADYLLGREELTSPLFRLSAGYRRNCVILISENGEWQEWRLPKERIQELRRRLAARS